MTALCLTVGCGSTRWSDSKRTATEQMLVSDAIERAVMRIDMQPLAGRSVFLDTTVLDDVSDDKYLTSALRHKLLASGCGLASDRDKAELVLEARAGAVGTDKNEPLLGIPATSVTVGGNGMSPATPVTVGCSIRGPSKTATSMTVWILPCQGRSPTTAAVGRLPRLALLKRICLSWSGEMAAWRREARGSANAL
ncbi:MAG: DUF6655 family protein, partial [Pirellulales bacterium]